ASRPAELLMMALEQGQNAPSERISKSDCFSTRLLVGAAGFEPATWSTQNSRATRLRYTPPGPRARRTRQTPEERWHGIDTRFARQRQCAVAPLLPSSAWRGERDRSPRVPGDVSGAKSDSRLGRRAQCRASSRSRLPLPAQPEPVLPRG